MIKGVLFDYGGVVGEGGRGIDVTYRLADKLGLSKQQAEEIIFPLFGQMTLGKLDTDDFWQQISEATGLLITPEKLSIWNTWWGTDVYPEMLALIHTLRAHGYQIGLLSNIIPPTRDHIKASGGYSHFDFAVLSCEVGLAKPDTRIFELALQKFDDLKPEEVVFIDDQQKSILPAEVLGMKTILATDSDQIIAELRKLGLPV
jgi:putative hydrolase of the HAD superfamily